jgi:hypothetical protein
MSIQQNVIVPGTVGKDGKIFLGFLIVTNKGIASPRLYIDLAETNRFLNKIDPALEAKIESVYLWRKDLELHSEYLEIATAMLDARDFS